MVETQGSRMHIESKKETAKNYIHLEISKYKKWKLQRISLQIHLVK